MLKHDRVRIYNTAMFILQRGYVDKPTRLCFFEDLATINLLFTGAKNKTLTEKIVSRATINVKESKSEEIIAISLFHPNEYPIFLNRLKELY